MNDDGILIMNVIDFLKDYNSLPLYIKLRNREINTPTKKGLYLLWIKSFSLFKWCKMQHLFAKDVLQTFNMAAAISIAFTTDPFVISIP